MLTKNQVLDALRKADGLPTIGKKQQRKADRTIYEIAGPRGHFHMDYATYPGGTTDEVPSSVIDELVREGLIQRAFPNDPHVNAWILA